MKFLNQSGQTLVLMIIFVSILLIFGTAIVGLSVSNIQSTSIGLNSEIVYQLAESGAENGILKLLRDPSYSGETITAGEGTVTISVSGSDVKVLTAQANQGTQVRTIQVLLNQENNSYTITSWKEI